MRSREWTDLDELTGLAAHLTQTCDRIEELAQRTEGMLRRVEELAASTTTQLEQTGLLPAAVQIAHVREQVTIALQPPRRHRLHGWRGRAHAAAVWCQTELRTQWIVARVKLGRHVMIPARRGAALLRKRFVLARAEAGTRTAQALDRTTTTLKPLARPGGVRVVIQPLRAPRMHLSSMANFAGAVAFCAVIVMLLVAVSATAPALGLPRVAPPQVAINVPTPSPLWLDALLAVPTPSRRITPVASTGAVAAPKPQAAATQATPDKSFVGTLVVESEPAGAAVFVNQERVGMTPLTLPQVRAGSRVVWVESEGYQRWSAGVTVPADKMTRLNVKLSRDPHR